MVFTSTQPNKRPAVSQAGPKSKKPHIEAIPSGKVRKRTQPVTQPIKDEKDDSSDESHVGGIESDLEGEDEEKKVAVPVKDPNASREAHKAQRVLLGQRRAAKPHSELLAEAKKAWRVAHQKNVSKTERVKHIHALMDVIRGNVKDIVLKHDASRIVQTLVRYGGEKERNEIAAELKGHYKELVQSKYSKFLVSKLIRLCPSHRAAILREFQGHVLRLLLHREASTVLADAFELYANAYERSLLLRDFYGMEASLFTVTAGSEGEKERSKRGFKGLLEDAEGERKKRLMTTLKANLVTILNNPDKGTVSHAILHRALSEYLSATNELQDKGEQEKLRREIFENCQEVLAEMVHTKEGSRVVRDFIAYGTAKDRKQIVKAIKPHIKRMCQDDEAQLVLFTALDVIDDTKLTAKSLVMDIASTASSLYTSPQGRRSLIYLVAPRTKRHFTPAQIATLVETDPIRSQTSKKDEVVRSAEVKQAASDLLLQWVTENGAQVSRDTGGSLVVCEIMLYAEGDKSAASDALLQALNAPSIASSPHPISLPHTSRLYKMLLQGGHYSQIMKTIEPAPLWSARAFALRFMKIVNREAVLEMARGEGAFVINALCEQLAGEEECEERNTLRDWFGKDVRKEIKETARKGSAVLLQSLETLG